MSFAYPIRHSLRMLQPLFVALLFILFVLPVLLLVLLMLSSRWVYPDLLPQGFSLRSLHYIVHESPGFLGSVLSSICYSLCASVLAFVLSLLPARVLARERFAAKGFVEALLMTPILLPVMTFSMGIHYLFLRSGLTASFVGVVLVITLYNYPYMLRALVSGYRHIPKELTLSARNLGASLPRVILFVEIPSLLPAIAAGFPILFLTAFSEYFLVFLIGGGVVPSLTGYLYPFIRSSDYQVSSLLVIIFLIVPLILFFIQDSLIHHIHKKRGLV